MLIQAEGARLLPVISRVYCVCGWIAGYHPLWQGTNACRSADGHIVLCLRHCGAAVIVLLRDMYMYRVLWVNVKNSHVKGTGQQTCKILVHYNTRAHMYSYDDAVHFLAHSSSDTHFAPH
jgi:hypothetical protein